MISIAMAMSLLFAQDTTDQFGISATICGDIDSDGTKYILVADTTERADVSGTLWVMSSGGNVIRSHQFAEHMPATLGSTGDVDRDGVRDYFCLLLGEGDSSLRLFSGRSGAALFAIDGQICAPIVVDDVDRDGNIDMLYLQSSICQPEPDEDSTGSHRTMTLVRRGVSGSAASQWALHAFTNDLCSFAVAHDTI